MARKDFECLERTRNAWKLQPFAALWVKDLGYCLMSLNFSNLFRFDRQCKSGARDQGSHTVPVRPTAREKRQARRREGGGGERERGGR